MRTPDAHLRHRSPLRSLATAGMLASMLANTSCAAGGGLGRQAGGADTRFQTDGNPVPAGPDALQVQSDQALGYHVTQITSKDDLGNSTTTDVAIWYPTSARPEVFKYALGKNTILSRLAVDGQAASGKFPLIVLSHGASGSGLTLAYLAEAIARHGYVVAAVDHTDEVFSARIDPAKNPGRQMGAAIQQLKYARKVRGTWLGAEALQSRRAISYRPRQLSATIDRVAALNKDASSPLVSAVDVNNVGLVGHSFGAWTVLASGGCIREFADPRAKAVVTLSGPVEQDLFSAAELKANDCPIMMFFGSTEVGQGRADDRSVYYDRLDVPRYMVEIEKADHVTFSAGVRKEYLTMEGYLRRDERRAAIARYTLAFMNRHLKGDAAAKSQLSIRGTGVSRYLFSDK